MQHYILGCPTGSLPYFTSFILQKLCRPVAKISDEHTASLAAWKVMVLGIAALQVQLHFNRQACVHVHMVTQQDQNKQIRSGSGGHIQEHSACGVSISRAARHVGSFIVNM